MAQVTGLAHVGIFVSDLKKSQKFYEDILGLKTTWECEFSADGNTFTIAFMGKGSLTLELVMRKNQTKLYDGVTDHVAMMVDNLEEMRAELEQKGIQFETGELMYCADMMPNGTKWVFFRGPDGEHIELSQVL